MTGANHARHRISPTSRAVLKVLRVRRVVDFAISVAIVTFALFPILWGLSTSLKAPNQILEYPPRFIPTPPTFEHYRTLIDSGIYTFILNSVVVSAFTVACCLVLGSTAAYALARFAFRGKALFLFGTVAVMSVPLPSLMVPTFTYLAVLGLVNSLTGLTILYTAYQLPITIWILYGYFQSLPVELDNAAMIDGYSRLAILRKIILPLSGPGLIASGLFVLTFAWNDFVVAVSMLSSAALRTLPVAIYSYLGFFGRDWGPLTASAVVSILPILAIFIFFQRYFLSGLTGGSVKG